MKRKLQINGYLKKHKVKKATTVAALGILRVYRKKLKIPKHVCLKIGKKGHRSLMVTVARLKDPGFATALVHLVFIVLSLSETGLLLLMKLGRNVMMRAGVKIMHQSNYFGNEENSFFLTE